MTKNKDKKIDIKKLELLLNLNEDSRSYFFEKADSRWLDFLWDKGLLDAIKKPAEDLSSYRYQMPELNYLSKVSEEKPDKVTDIILSIGFSKDNFNPEVIDRLQRLISSLPVKNIIKLAPKIQQENWAKLMGNFNQLGFDYEEILKKLYEAKEFESLIKISDVVLSIRGKDEVKQITKYTKGSPFYLPDLSYLNVFKYLSETDEKNIDNALMLLINKLNQILLLEDKEPKGEFEKQDPFTFYDINFFSKTVDFDNKNHYSHNDSTAKLGMAIKVLLERFIEKNKENERAIREFYSDVIINLPNSRKMWELRLFFYLLCNEQLQLDDEIKEARKKIGDPDEHTDRSFGEVTSGTVVPQPAGSDDDWKQSVEKIVNKLKTDWSAEALSSRPENKDFLRPLDVEGTGERLKTEIKNRPKEFIANSKLFFDRDKLNPHYTYDYLRAVEELLKGNLLGEDENTQPIIDLIKKIVLESTNNPLPDGSEKDSWGWRANWQSVLMALTDVIQELLKYENRKYELDFDKNRKDLLSAIDFLLRNKDPESKDEEDETAKIKTQDPGSNKYVASDPFTTAINSIRGRAFQAFVFFIHQDGEELCEDTQKIYEGMLKDEKTQAIYFMFGHYLATFYYRDKEKKWINKQLENIFPVDTKKINLLFASFEGYFSNNLFEEIFFDENIQALYKKAIDVSSKKTDRKFFRDPDSGIAVHVALAFLHYKDKFNTEHELYKYFWDHGNENQHTAFVNFIGSALISGDSSRITELIKKDPEIIQRIKDFWDWMIDNYNKSRKPFEEFGFWINLDKEIFSPKEIAERISKTLEKTDGVLDWDYGLSKHIVKLAEEAPEETLKIAEYHIYKAGVQNKENRKYMHLDEGWYKAFEVLYKNDSTKENVKVLISKLMRDGSRTFWSLGEMINEVSKG